MSTANICKGTELSNCESTATAVISDYYTTKQPQFGAYMSLFDETILQIYAIIIISMICLTTK